MELTSELDRINSNNTGTSDLLVLCSIDTNFERVICEQ